MWNRIYLGVLLLAVLITGSLHWYALSWLGSIAGPQSVIPQYWTFSSLGLSALVIISLILLLIGAISFWTVRSSWQLWTTLAFFVLFTGLRYFYIYPHYALYLEANRMTDSGMISATATGLVLIIFGVAVVFITNFVLQRMYDKMYPVPVPTVESDGPADGSETERRKSDAI